VEVVIMKRIALSLAVPFAALVLGVSAPGEAAAHGGGWGHDHGQARAAAPVVQARGWHGAPAPRYAPAPRHAPEPRYAPRAYVRPAPHWSWRGPTRVWIGVPTVRPYAGWVWTPAQWVWDGGQWVWQDGFWSPSAY
jgi:hypothetical protein